MKEIKGKNYYISLGYIDKEKLQDGINAKDIVSIFMEPSDDSAIYYNKTDKDNIIALPLIPVNDIQRNGDEYYFHIHVNPNKIQYPDNEEVCKVNIIGLFSEYKNYSVQFIKHISFFETNFTEYLRKGDRFLNIKLHVNADKILGE